MPDMRKVFYAKVLRLLKFCDLAIEVTDARDIEGTRVTKLDRHFRNKVIIVAAKSDMVPGGNERPNSLERMPLIYFSSRTREGLADIFREIRARGKEKKLEEVRVLVFGIPNVGKSSLINVMRGRHSAVTGFRPGITRGPQWVKIQSGILLLDTPGVVDLKETREALALKAAFDVDGLPDPEKLALDLIEKFSKKGNEKLFENYGIAAQEGQDPLVSLAKKRGLLLKGGEPNTFEAAKIIIRDFQKGKFVL
jgi:ribosome biogenesis GTPase A